MVNSGWLKARKKTKYLKVRIINSTNDAKQESNIKELKEDASATKATNNETLCKY